MNFTTIPSSEILSYTFTFQQVNPSPSDFVSGTFTQSNLLIGMPPNYAVCAVKILPVIAFVGTGVTGFTVGVGVTGQANFYATAFNIMQSSSYQIETPLAVYSAAPHDINANFTSTGAVVNLITAGKVLITLQIRPLP